MEFRLTALQELHHPKQLLSLCSDGGADYLNLLGIGLTADLLLIAPDVLARVGRASAMTFLSLIETTWITTAGAAYLGILRIPRK